MKSSLARSVAAAVLAASSASALNADAWRSQSIYQVMTDRFARTDVSTTSPCNDLRAYCGGTYQGLIKKLDYIQGMGFTAVWISPVVKNIDGYTRWGDAYHGYWAQDIWSLNSHFGTESDLLALSKALHDRGMHLMVDVVTNHMGYNGCGTCVNYNIYNAEFRNKDLFHPFCLIDYDNASSVVTCWQGDNEVSLPDLKTEDSRVRDVFNKWISQLVTKYSIDGLRIDSTKHVEKDFWPQFGQAAGVYMVGEVLDGNPQNLAGWMNSIDGVMNYASFYWIQRAFKSAQGTVNELITETNNFKNIIDTTLLGSFIENHDQPRFPSVTSDTGRIKTAIAFSMLSDGIPIIYQGQEQAFSGSGDPNNREAVWLAQYNTSHEMYRLIAQVNQIRNQAIFADRDGYLNYKAVAIKINDYALALRKGSPGAQIVGVFSNMGNPGVPYQVTLNGRDTGFRAGEKVVEVLGCQTLTADGSGNLSVQITAGPRVLYPQAKLVGSGVCSM